LLDKEDVDNIDKTLDFKYDILNDQNLKEKDDRAPKLNKLNVLKLSALTVVDSFPDSTPRGDYEGKSTSADFQLSTRSLPSNRGFKFKNKDVKIILIIFHKISLENRRC